MGAEDSRVRPKGRGSAKQRFSCDVGVIGGAGHVGLPLALTLADSGLKTLIHDVDQKRVQQIRAGVMPFKEEGAQEILDRVLSLGSLEVETSGERLSACRFLVLIIGTPVDEHLNPTFTGIYRAIQSCIGHLRDGQILILRSTVFPGTSKHLQQYLSEQGLDVSVAFCPERVAQGHSLREFRQLPQIVSAFDRPTLKAVKGLFSRFSRELLEMSPMEAELCKLMTNAWRYIQFATVNQFYVIATRHGLDFERVLHGCKHDYPRMAGMPRPGLAAGPCLVKDTMQLAAFSQNNFVLGHAAMLVNEGLPAHLIELAKREIDLSRATAGVLGMAFKAEIDDPRDSLSYKLKKLLTMEAKRVLCCDPFVKDEGLVDVRQVIRESDVLFLATPHEAYRDLSIPKGKVLVDVWGWARPSTPRSKPRGAHPAHARRSGAR